ELDVTVAVLEIDETLPPTVTTSANCADVPLGTLFAMQVIAPFAPGAGVAQLSAGPLDCVSETNTVPGGSESLNPRSVTSGPLLVIVIAYVTLLPATAVAGPVLTMAASASLTITVAVDESFSA